MMAGARGSWSHDIRSQEVGKDESRCSLSPFNSAQEPSLWDAATHDHMGLPTSVD